MARKFVLQLVVVFVDDAVVQGGQAVLSTFIRVVTRVFLAFHFVGVVVLYTQGCTHVPLALVGGWVVCLALGLHLSWAPYSVDRLNTLDTLSLICIYVRPSMLSISLS
jgi:hypothetical protein